MINLTITKDLLFAFAVGVILVPVYIRFAANTKIGYLKLFLTNFIISLQSILISFVVLFGLNYFGNINLDEFNNSILLMALALSILFNVHYEMSFSDLERKLWKKYDREDIVKLSISLSNKIFLWVFGFMLFLLIMVFVLGSKEFGFHILVTALILVVNLAVFYFITPQIISLIQKSNLS